MNSIFAQKAAAEWESLTQRRNNLATIIQTHAIEPALEAEKNKWIAEGMRRAAETIDVTEPSAPSVRKAKILTAAEQLLKGAK